MFLIEAAVDGLLFMRRMAARLLAEEFDLESRQEIKVPLPLTTS